MRTVASGGVRSRARLAEATGLNKATVSSLILELMNRGLVTEGNVQLNRLGRPGRSIEVDTEGVRCIGLELTVSSLTGVIIDLNGNELARRQLALPVGGLRPVKAVGDVADIARALLADCGAIAEQVQTLHLSLPSLVDGAGVLVHASELRWDDVDLVNAIRGRLGWIHTRIGADIDANFCAVAEFAYGSAVGSANMLYLGGARLRAGILVEGRLLRGARGLAGGLAHLPIGDRSIACSCGRLGCWESAVGIDSLVNAICEVGDDLRDADTTVQLEQIACRAEAGDTRTLQELNRVGRLLGRGARALGYLLDPELIVFGGYFATLRRYLTDAVTCELRLVLSDCDVTAPKFEFSNLGSGAAALGAAYVGIEMVLDDPSVVVSAGVRSV